MGRRHAGHSTLGTHTPSLPPQQEQHRPRSASRCHDRRLIRRWTACLVSSTWSPFHEPAAGAAEHV